MLKKYRNYEAPTENNFQILIFSSTKTETDKDVRVFVKSVLRQQSKM